MEIPSIEKEGASYHPNYTVSFVKHGGGSFMAWACMAASGTSSFKFIDDITHDVCSIFIICQFRE